MLVCLFVCVKEFDVEVKDKFEEVEGVGGGWRARGVSDRVVLSAPLQHALQGSPGACSVK